MSPHHYQPAAFCCLIRIMSILRWYLLCHNYEVCIAVSYGALYQSQVVYSVLSNQIQDIYMSI
jgi:hypothetical protein